MATLVLTVAGSAIGGPLGGALGAALGGAIDRSVLFAPSGREGPRLSDLRIQTSAYGTPIPQLFGTLRTAGCVIWATDLMEHRSTDGGGKGGPSTTRYSYTASFAVALSARPIIGVRRIWAEGKLLRGAAGDFKVRTGFRLHLGGEEQAPDPLIASAEGVGATPAHRGIAYAVFEDLQLAEFGNRIPALTFEVIADAQPVATGAIAETVSDGLVTAESGTRELEGFSAHGASRRAVIETLAGAANGWFADDARGMTLAHGGGAATPVADAGAGAEGDTRRTPRTRTISPIDSAPRALTLTHYDNARDYQTSVQRAVRSGAGTREARLELPAVLSAAAAKTLAAEALARMELERERRTVALDWSALDVTPGARVTIAGVPGVWRVDRWTLEAMIVRLECVRVAPAALPVGASGGRALNAADRPLGRTMVEAFELPPLDEQPAGAPQLAIAAAGTGPGWRGAALLLSTDEGARWETLGASAYPAVLGSIVAPPGHGSAALEDRVNHVDVALAHPEMMLFGADAAGLDAGANLAMLGEELIQFGDADPLGANRWRLRRLRRGRRGTEAAIGGQSAGDRFVLLSSETLRRVDMPGLPMGSSALVLAQGAGDDTPAQARAAVTGISLLPRAPVHVGTTIRGDGSGSLHWVRRSRIGWRWSDGADAPLGEEREAYRVTIASAGGERLVTVDAPSTELTEAECRTGFTAMVRQAGTHGLSPPARFGWPARGEEQ